MQLKENVDENFPGKSISRFDFFCQKGDVKSYLQRCVPEKESFRKRGTPLKFVVDMAAGLASLHRHGYLHQ